MRYFLYFCRILVGATFIVSGLVKANDPVGFGIKLEEYFEPSALGWPALIPYALPLAMLACLGEVVLGFAILVGGRMKLATAAILALTLFFGWLTGYTWNCNAQHEAGAKMTYTVIENGAPVEKDKTCVTDCGCFGDAMKGSLGRSLTPKESFIKDMILLVFLLPVFAASWFGKGGIVFNTPSDDRVLWPGALLLIAAWCWVFGWNFFLLFGFAGFIGYFIIKRFVHGVRAEWTTAGWITLITFGFIWYCWQHLPLKDYRPYAIGKNIHEEQNMGTPPVQDIYVIYKNTKTGEKKEFDSKGKYPWDDSTWVYVDRRIDVHKAGVESPVKDFKLTDKDGVDITNDVLNEPTPILLIVMKTIADANTKCLPAIETLTDEAYKNGWYVYGATSGSYEEIEKLRHDNQLAFDFTTCDEVTLKTMIRSNPGVMLLQQGTVRGQWHCNDVPTLAEAKKMLKQ